MVLIISLNWLMASSTSWIGALVSIMKFGLFRKPLLISELIGKLIREFIRSSSLIWAPFGTLPAS